MKLSLSQSSYELRDAGEVAFGIWVFAILGAGLAVLLCAFIGRFPSPHFCHRARDLEHRNAGTPILSSRVSAAAYLQPFRSLCPSWLPAQIERGGGMGGGWLHCLRWGFRKPPNKAPEATHRRHASCLAE
jgi:hypothetical protein